MPQLEVSTAAVRVGYFSTLPFRETPFADLVGTHPISQADAKQRNHYRFEYDERGRPIRVTFMLGDNPRAPNHTANFFFRTTRVDILYEPGREIRHFYDRFGNPAKARGVYREVYEVGENGYRQRLTFENPDGGRSHSSWGVGEYRWRIEQDGTVIEDHFDLDGEVVIKRPNLTFYQLRLHYGPNGWLALMENFGPNGDGLINNTMNAAQDMLEYDANGDMRAWNVFDETRTRVKGNSPGVHRGLRDYNENGYISRTYYEDEEGERMKSAYGWGESETMFDDFGNMVARWTGTKDGEPAINELLHYSGFVRTWDESGLLEVSRKYFLEDRVTPAIHARSEAHKIVYEYDSAGNRVRMELYGAGGLLVRSLNLGAAVIEYAYDGRNRLVEQRLLNTNRSLANNDDGWAVERYSYDEHELRLSPVRLDDELQPIVTVEN
jgi:YD repeat-containing protein